MIIVTFLAKCDSNEKEALFQHYQLSRKLTVIGRCMSHAPYHSYCKLLMDSINVQDMGGGHYYKEFSTV